MPDPNMIKYVVRTVGRPETEEEVDDSDEAPVVSSLILPSAALQRPARNHVNKDRIKFFIRQTGQLDGQMFVPRVCATLNFPICYTLSTDKRLSKHCFLQGLILARFNVHPKGALKWADLFANPEPRWPELTPPRLASGEFY